MIHPCVKGKNIGVAHASLQRSRSLTRAASATGLEDGASKSGRKRCEPATGARDSGRHLEGEGIWKERCIWRGQVELFW